MRKWKILAGLAVVLLLTGCQAGTSAQLLAFDNVEAATSEVKKGVEAYDTSVRASSTKLRSTFIKAVGQDVVMIALSENESEATAKKLADAVMANLSRAMNDFEEQERRRAELFNAIMDNIAFVFQVCENARAFELYRANISEQIKAYVENQARAKLRRVGDIK